MSAENPSFLPYGRQSVDEDDIEAVAAVLRGDWLTTGPAIECFEGELAQRVGAEHAVVCSNGTAALHLSMLALGLGEGDAVVVPTITFLATANAARYVGAEVVFADVDPETGLMGAQELEMAIERCDRGRPAAVAPVHYSGQCVNMPEISAIARQHGMSVVEDAAHALGTQYDHAGETHSVGACRHSDIAMFSFHAVKTITMGEGGAVTTSNRDLAAKARMFRSHGMTNRAQDFANAELGRSAEDGSNPWYYEMQHVGFNYRATDIQCALGTSQLKKLDEFVAKRSRLAAIYDERLASLANFIVPLRRVENCRPAWHLYAVRINFAELDIDRAGLMKRLREYGIGSQVHYIPVHLQPYYQSRYGALTLTAAESLYEELLSLPLYPAMAKSDVARVVDALTEVVEENKSVQV